MLIKSKLRGESLNMIKISDSLIILFGRSRKHLLTGKLSWLSVRSRVRR